MPWKERDVVESRYSFILDIESGFNHAEACRAHGIDRKTGYKWLSRYQSGGLGALVDQSRCAHHHPHALSDQVAQLLLSRRRKHPSWGAKKIIHLVGQAYPSLKMPARSTANELFRKHGLLESRKKRERRSSYESPLAGYHGPNAVWCMDFKGTMTLQGKRSDPFSVSDGVTRFLIRLSDLSNNRCAPVKRCLKTAFNEYGMPDVMRSDNGPPFATLGLAGLGALQVWLIKLGIVPERIKPGCPTQNGRHERIHKTLEDDIDTHKAKGISLQSTLDRFRQSYNHVRPHESLDMKTPAQVYVPSPKMYPAKLRDPEYKENVRCERLGQKGELFFRGQSFYLNKALAKEVVGIDFDQGEHPVIYFGPIKLGTLYKNGFKPRPKRTKTKNKKENSNT